MKTLHYSIIIILTMTMCIGINTAYALLVPSPFVSSTDKLQYNAGEIIKISGMVANSMFQPNQTITIDIFDPNGRLYQNSTVNLELQNNPYSNGLYNYGYTYEYDMKTDNKTIAGSYQIVAHYGKDEHNTNTVLYDPIHMDYTRYYTYNAFFGNTPYQIRYKATQGNELQGLGMDTTSKILYISAKGVENKIGHLTLELPRRLIDSRIDNSTDKNFTVAMGAMGGGISYTNDFQEIQSNDQNRTLQFNILPYDGNYLIMLSGTSIYQTETIKQNNVSPPLKQFKAGINPADIKCNQGFQLIFKAEDNSPACVKPDTASKLVELGWAKKAQSQIVFHTEPCDISCKENNEKIGRTCIKQSDGNYLCKSASRFAISSVIPWGSKNMPYQRNFILPNMIVSLEINNTVEWSNADDFPHMIQSDNGLFSPIVIQPNGIWAFTFNKTGTYGYHGDYPWLKGKITVVGFDPNYNFVPPLFKGTNSPEVYYYLFRENDSFWYIKSVRVIDNDTVSVVLSDYENNTWIGNPVTKTLVIDDSFIGNCGDMSQYSQVEFLTLDRIVTSPTPFAEFKDQTGIMPDVKCMFDKLEK